jgi:hypothetical protein
MSLSTANAIEITGEISGCRNHFCLQEVERELPMSVVIMSGISAVSITLILLKSDETIELLENYEQTGVVDHRLNSVIKEIQLKFFETHNLAVTDDEVLALLEREI